jgi:hypothetical protein
MADAGMATAITIEATAGDLSVWTVLEPGLSPTFFGVLITVTIGTQTIDAIVSLDLRPAYGSDTGRIELATITVPDLAVAGSVFLYRIGAHSTVAIANQQRAEMGYQLVAEQKVAATGTTTGDYQPFVLYTADPEQFVNMPNVTIVND